MKNHSDRKCSRRTFLKGTAAGFGVLGVPLLALGAPSTKAPLTRVLGRTGLEVTTFGLGGQGTMMWTAPGLDPEDIIAKAYQLGTTYYDTSNVYGKSQEHYGKVFQELGLAPGRPNYDEKKRRAIVVASKTMIRYARGGDEKDGKRTDGPDGSTVVDDLRRSLTQVFGDGKGSYPDDAYFDVFQIHNLTSMGQVDLAYEGLDDATSEKIGVLAALVDYRDGTNVTGFNPKEEKRLRHIGITGHRSSPTLMEFIQRDTRNVVDTVLTVANVNDRRYLNHQYNVIPLAAAKGLGVIGMKVFSDGAMYTKLNHWTIGYKEVVHTVGSAEIPSDPLIHYALSIPGITTNIIGIGHVDTDPTQCQLERNLAASQLHDTLDEGARREIEPLGLRSKEGVTNYFQSEHEPLSAPRNGAVEQMVRDGSRRCRLTWHTAYAGDEPIARYEVIRDGQVVGGIDHAPQTTLAPFAYEDAVNDTGGHEYRIRVVDVVNRSAETENLKVEATG
jgi:aryl-alcohol dehydrogenase-like predicted oxidoreductase